MDNFSWIKSIPLIGNLLMAEQGGATFWDALPILQTGLLACLVCSVICAFLGVHIILRRTVFVSAAISQVSSLGLAFAILITQLTKHPDFNTNMESTSMLSIPGLCSILGAAIAASIFASKGREQRLTRESILGVAYVLPSALVLIILDRLSGETHMIENVLFGNTVFVDPLQLKALVIITLIVFVIHLLLFKEFISVAFDRDVSGASGIPVTFYDQLFYLTLALTISFAIGSIGTLPVFGFMVIPAASALLLTTRLRLAFLVSAIIGLVSAATGFYLSFLYSLPTGPSMLAVSGIILICSAFLSLLKR